MSIEEDGFHADLFSALVDSKLFRKTLLFFPKKVRGMNKYGTVYGNNIPLNILKPNRKRTLNHSLVV